VTYDLKDPDPLDLLTEKTAARYSAAAAAAYIKDQRNRSARYFLPFARPFCAALLVVARTVRMLVPRRLNGNDALHGLIVWGVRNFCTPEATLLILRHVHLGTQILDFLAVNLGVEPEGVEDLRPRGVADLRDDAFLKHDLNVFNFLHAVSEPLKAPKTLDFSMLTDELDLDIPPARWSQVIDLETAVTFYTLMYAVFLPKAAFERASHSLQFDEEFARLISVVVGQPGLAAMVSNRHPMLRLPTTGTASRVMVHGLETEALHHLLLQMAASKSRREQPKARA
jgi:hypothetical protein